MKTFYTLVLLSALFLNTSCTTNRAYWVRDTLSPEEDNSDRWAILPSEIDEDLRKEHHWFKGYGKSDFYPKLRIAEYDDHGDRWESRQTQTVLDLIARAKPGTDVIAFIHGWRNRAKPSSSDLIQFSNFLTQYTETNGEGPVGVFIGWRGSSVTNDYPVGTFPNLAYFAETFSFMNRRAAITRVAGVPRADDLWKIRRASNKRGCRVILVGHSFGGRILDRVASQSIIAARSQIGFLTSRDTGKRDADRMRRSLLITELVLLVNPANEALHTRQMVLALKDWPDESPPIIVSMLSDTDNANRQIWEFGKTAERTLTSTVPRQDRNSD